MPNPEVKNAPFIFDLIENAGAQAGARVPLCRPGHRPPFVAPPDMPADRRLKMLRDAFNATMKDPDFIADAKKQKLDVHPEDGQNLEALIRRIYATPKPIWSNRSAS